MANGWPRRSCQSAGQPSNISTEQSDVLTKTSDVSSDVLYYVDLSYACYGVIVRHEKVIHAAPIARWAIGKPFAELVRFIKRKRGTVIQCKNQHNNEEQNHG